MAFAGQHLIRDINREGVIVKLKFRTKLPYDRKFKSIGHSKNRKEKAYHSGHINIGRFLNGFVIGRGSAVHLANVQLPIFGWLAERHIVLLKRKKPFALIEISGKLFCLIIQFNQNLICSLEWQGLDFPKWNPVDLWKDVKRSITALNRLSSMKALTET